MMTQLFRIVLVLLLLPVPATPAFAAKLTYNLEPVEVSEGCYAVVGGLEYFSKSNGGNIVNTGFIITDEGVVVVDTGPSKRYGTEFRQLIDHISGGLPVLKVIITHLHPDHYLGNQAFSDAPILAGRKTIAGINQQGEDFTLNMYRLVGDWMRGTESIAPAGVVDQGVMEVGGHRIRIMHLSGHTGEDIVVADETCGVLYSGDLVFNRRTLATSHANIDEWKGSLDALLKLPFKTIVPGHGAVATDSSAIRETIDYLNWLEQILSRAYHSGLDITEVMELPIPGRFGEYALAKEEFRRSVSNLFPGIEAENLPVVND